ncbi:MAG: hypothetical protein JSR81_01640 [Proteobacteria bacterium]|nr:hypothetical protein [Pseudomonadota bacterium]
MNRILLVAILALSCMACTRQSQAASSGPPQSAIEKTIVALFPSTDFVKQSVDFHQIRVGPARAAHTAEVYGIPGGTTYWNILARYTVRTRNHFDPSNPGCTAQDVSQLYIAHKSDFGDWSISQVSGSENHTGAETHVPCN